MSFGGIFLDQVQHTKFYCSLYVDPGLPLTLHGNYFVGRIVAGALASVVGSSFCQQNKRRLPHLPFFPSTFLPIHLSSHPPFFSPTFLSSLVFIIMAQTTNYLPSPQPNYHRLSQIHREFADELTKMSNTPQSDIGRTLDRMNEKLNEVNTAVQKLDGKIDTVA
jgi:hypothetical protein